MTLFCMIPTSSWRNLIFFYNLSTCDFYTFFCKRYVIWEYGQINLSLSSNFTHFSFTHFNSVIRIWLLPIYYSAIENCLMCTTNVGSVLVPLYWLPCKSIRCKVLCFLLRFELRRHIMSNLNKVCQQLKQLN